MTVHGNDRHRPMNEIPLLFVGPLPPPVHGQANSTQYVLNLVRSELARPVRVINTSERGVIGNAGRMHRLASHLLAANAIITGQYACAYLSVNARGGLVLTRLLARLAKLRKIPVVFHHHYYWHFAEFDKAVEAMARAAGPSAWHVTNCVDMSRQMEAIYPAIRRTAAFSNIGAVRVRAIDKRGRDKSASPTLGHMSNLSKAKGIEKLFEAFRSVKAEWSEARLIVGGPIADEVAERAVADAKVEFGNSVEFLGPLSDADKPEFFERIDVFFNPTTGDTQGIVNLEALASGVPVVATALCCIPSDIGETGGLVASHEQLTQSLLEYLDNNKDRLSEAGTKAQKRFDELWDHHVVEQKHLMTILDRPENP